MRSDPDPQRNAYRTLGLEPGASMAEVKRAYRLLAKAFHPDSAGETALPRFLAIHEAYEVLRTGRAPIASATAKARSAPTAEPWRADPARARAARERARTGRPGPDTPGGRSRATGGSRAPGGSSGTTGTPPGGTRGGGRRRDVRKATMGSTSYDEARDPADATWGGASWYGPSSGEYWIVNPREYADPRKHGPEYQSRARRRAGAALDRDPAIDADPAIDGDPANEPDAEPASIDPSSEPAATAGGTRARQTSWARAGQGASTSTAGADPRGGSWSDPAIEPRASQEPGPFAAASPARWLGAPADDPIRRMGIALVAWPPLGLAAAGAIGQVTGCLAYSSACTGPEPLLPWLAQAVILGLLLLLPPLARVLAGGTIAVLVALAPVTAFLLAVGGSGAPQAPAVLGVLLAAAWLVGVGWAALAVTRRRGLERTP